MYLPLKSKFWSMKKIYYNVEKCVHNKAWAWIILFETIHWPMIKIVNKKLGDFFYSHTVTVYIDSFIIFTYIFVLLNI